MAKAHVSRRGWSRWTKKPAAAGVASGRRSPSRLRFLRHPLRAFVMAIAALSIAWGITGAVGNVMAVIGAIAGVAVGEVLARSRLRLWAVGLYLFAGVGLVWLLAWGFSATELISGSLGTGAALTLGVMTRFSAWALFPVATMRVFGARVRGLLAVELAAVVAAVAWLFAAHRDGVIERPHWLSDWAWRADLDPTDVLIAVGAVAAVVLAMLMVWETQRRSSYVTALILPALALLALALFDVSVLPQPRAANDLGLTQTSEGDDPLPTNGGDPGPSGGQPTDKQGQGQGDKPGDPQGQGQGDKPGDQQGQGQQQGDQQGQGQQQGDQQGQGQQQGDQQGQGQQQDQQGQGQQQDQQGQGQQPQEPDVEDESTSPQNKAAPMAVVLLDDDYSPPSQMYYFRQEVWSHFTGSRLVAPRRSDVDRDLFYEYPSLATDVPDQPPKEGRSLIHAHVSLLVEHKKPFFLESPTRYLPRRNPNLNRFVRTYSFESLSQVLPYRELVGRAAGDPAWPEEIRDYYLKGPTDPRYAALATQIVGELAPPQRADPFLKALAVKLHFDKTLTYSTRHRHAGAADPTADFLFGDKTGYCVHFAHSAVYLWRSLGIPARISTGYATTEDDRLGATIVIQSGDAHSWPELYLTGIGWVILDISAHRNLDPPGSPPDEEMMRKLADMARDEPVEPDEEPPLEEEQEQSMVSGTSIALGLLVAIIAFVTALYLIKLWRRLIPLVATRRAQPRVSYRLALDLLGEAGMSRRYGETRIGFADRIARRAPSFPRLTELNLAARFGDPDVPIEERSEHRRDAWCSGIKQLRRDLAERTRWRRRALGLLDPASFFASR